MVPLTLAWQVGVIVVLLAGALVVGLIAERLRVPYTVALVSAGLAISLDRNASPFDFSSSLLFLFLPALLFEAAWNLNVAALKRTWRAIAILAVPGVLVTMAIVGACMMFAGLGWQSAFALGAIVSATDPVAVIATFRRIAVPLDLQTIVEGESLANDGVAVVLGVGMVELMTGGISVPHVLLEEVGSMLGGIAIGLAGAYVVALLIRGVRDAQMRTVATVLVAYGPPVIAALVHASAIFAAIAGGIALRALLERSGHADEMVETFWGVVAFLANSLVFLSMGLTMRLDRLAGEPALLLGAIGAAILSRLVVAYGLPPLREIREGGFIWRGMIALAGMRGGLAVAFALSLPVEIPQRAAIVDGVFAVVVFTVLVQGLAIGPVAARAWPTGEV